MSGGWILCHIKAYNYHSTPLNIRIDYHDCFFFPLSLSHIFRHYCELHATSLHTKSPKKKLSYLCLLMLTMMAINRAFVFASPIKHTHFRHMDHVWCVHILCTCSIIWFWNHHHIGVCALWALFCLWPSLIPFPGWLCMYVAGCL